MNNIIIGESKANIIFIYFDDFQESCKILEDKFGFSLKFSYGFASMYWVNDNFFIGAVDNTNEVRKHDTRSCMFCSTVANPKDLEKIRNNMISKGIVVSEIKNSTRLNYINFTAKGPEGYDFEFGHFTDGEEFEVFNPSEI